jgi:hypothetical protein
VTSKTELLLFLGLPPQAGADEIELIYLERRAKAEKRLRQGDTRARFEIERLDGVFGRLDGIDAKGEESGTAPVAVAMTSAPSLLRPAGSIREARGSVALGIAACLVVLWAFFVYRSSLTGGSLNILNLLQSPVYLLVFLLAFGAEALSYMSHRDESRARYLARQGLESPNELESQVSYARVGRWLGRIAVALAVLLAILLVTSLFHLLEHKAS